MQCEYFVLCDRPAEGVVANPVIGDVPCCQRCADRVGLELVRRGVMVFVSTDYANVGVLTVTDAAASIEQLSGADRIEVGADLVAGTTFQVGGVTFVPELRAS